MSTLALWSMNESLESAEEHFRIADRHPSRSLIINRDRISDALQNEAERDSAATLAEVELRLLSRTPTPTLVIGEPTFVPHLFLEGFNYVSRRLRDILDLPLGVVHCQPVDATRCVEPARTAGYTTFQPVHVADPIDQEQSDGEWVDTIERDGSLGRMWMPMGGPTHPAPRIVLRAGFRPPAPVFRQPDGGPPIVTDEIAERVLRAGIADIMFIRLGQERGQTENVCKAL